MNNKAYYKSYIEKLINFNPTDIIISRKVKTENDYRGTSSEIITIKERVTFYDKKARREVITDYGKTYTGVSVTKILARGNANILKDDIFKANGYKFKVLFVNNYFDICKQIELEVIE